MDSIEIELFSIVFCPIKCMSSLQSLRVMLQVVLWPFVAVSACSDLQYAFFIEFIVGLLGVTYTHWKLCKNKSEITIGQAIRWLKLMKLIFSFYLASVVCYKEITCQKIKILNAVVVPCMSNSQPPVRNVEGTSRLRKICLVNKRYIHFTFARDINFTSIVPTFRAQIKFD